MPGGAHENMKAWAPEEDHIILEMHASEGPKWSKIVQRLPGRTVSSVRNRWQRIEKGRKLREAGKESKNRCHSCGQLKRGHVCYAKMAGGPQVQIRNSPTVSPAGRPNGAGVPLMPPPASVAGGTAFSVMPPLRHTRSSERLRAPPEPHIVVEGGQSGPRGALSVDINVAGPPRGPPSRGGDLPLVARSNTSFFSTLANSELFSPSSRDLLSNWANSPRDGMPSSGLPPQPPAADRLLERMGESDAPPALQRVASGEMQVPKITRSLTSFLNQATESLDGPDGAGPPPPAWPALLDSTADDDFKRKQQEAKLSGEITEPAADTLPPPLVKRKSSRLSFTDLADIFDP